MKFLRRILVWFRKRFGSANYMDLFELGELSEQEFVEYCASVFGLKIGEPQEGAMPGPFFMFKEGMLFKDAVLFIDIRKFWTATHVASIKGPKPSPEAWGVVFYTP